MAAPLFSKFNRYFDRDVRLLAKKDARLIGMMRVAKNKARVYSLSPSAAAEAGKMARLPPEKLMHVVQEAYLPAEYVWVELPWQEYLTEANKDFGVPFDTVSHPTRVGVLALPVYTDRKNAFGAFVYYQFPTKGTMLCPIFAEISQEPQAPIAAHDVIAKSLADSGVDVTHSGIGFGYAATYASHKKALAQLSRLVEAIPTSAALMSTQMCINTLLEVNGLARMVLCVLGIVAASSQKRYVVRNHMEAEASGKNSRGSSGSHEISLYLDAEPSGEAAVRALRKGAASRRRFHEVAGHYAYRQSSAGSPRVCSAAGREGIHEFVNVTEKRQECVHCGQARWFKAAFHRGDAELGVVEPKVRVVHGAKKKEVRS